PTARRSAARPRRPRSRAAGARRAGPGASASRRRRPRVRCSPRAARGSGTAHGVCTAFSRPRPILDRFSTGRGARSRPDPTSAGGIAKMTAKTLTGLLLVAAAVAPAPALAHHGPPKLVFTRTEVSLRSDEDSPLGELWVMNADGTDRRQLTH